MKKETVYVTPRISSVCVKNSSLLCLSGPTILTFDLDKGVDDEEEECN